MLGNLIKYMLDICDDQQQIETDSSYSSEKEELENKIRHRLKNLSLVLEVRCWKASLLGAKEMLSHG